MWTLPLGFLECGETLEEGAAREVREETGVAVDPERRELSSIMNLVALGQVAVTFRVACSDEPVVKAGRECLEAGFKSEQEIAGVELAWAFMSSGQFFATLRAQKQSIKILTPRPGKSPSMKVRKYQVVRPPLIGKIHE